MSTADTLRRAKQNIIDKGWRQGSRWIGNIPQRPGCCAFDAFELFNTQIGNANGAIAKLVEAMGVPGINDGIVWNDTPGRTVDEVLAVYDKAIALAEAAP